MKSGRKLITQKRLWFRRIFPKYFGNLVRGFRIRESVLVEFSEKRKTISLFSFNEISFNHSEDRGVEVLKTFTTSMFNDRTEKTHRKNGGFFLNRGSSSVG